MPTYKKIFFLYLVKNLILMKIQSDPVVTKSSNVKFAPPKKPVIKLNRR